MHRVGVYNYMLADSHCHLDRLDLSSYNGDLNKALVMAQTKDVEYILCPGIDLENFPNILKIIETNNNIFGAVGVHPTEKTVRMPSLQELITLGLHKKVVGIGETGLDFYYANDEVQRERQRGLFKLHIQAAKALNKPLIVHSRDAEADITKTLVDENAAIVGGVMHCFTGSQALAEKMLELGFYISFSGIVTFRNAQPLREIAKNMLLEKMLIETDSPYLAPVPIRGKSNEPAYLHYIAEFIAKLRGMSYESFAAQTTENFLRFCGLVVPPGIN
jgi:TatD DNase family protein